MFKSRALFIRHLTASAHNMSNDAAVKVANELESHTFVLGDASSDVEDDDEKEGQEGESDADQADPVTEDDDH